MQGLRDSSAVTRRAWSAALTPQLAVATLGRMLRGSEPPESPVDPEVEAADASPTLDLAAMPIAGLTRGRLLALAGVIAASWIAFAFWRQVGAAGELTDRADGLRIGNAQLEARVADLEAELELVQTPEYIALAARGYRLGTSREI